MTKIIIPFISEDHSKIEKLTFNLYDHELAQQWMKLVFKSQVVTNASYKESSEIYGVESIDELESKLRYSIMVLKRSFADIWSDEIFSKIHEKDFPINQDNLNLAHAFFEKITFFIRTNPHLQNKYCNILSLLNHTVHKFEYHFNVPDGILVSSTLTGGFSKTIDPSLNSLFSMDTKFGQLNLGYCHIGEDFIDTFRKNHVLPAVPQTLMSGDFTINFDPDTIFNERQQLQEWLSKYFNRDINMSELPLGRVPLAEIDGSYTYSEMKDFFSKFTSIKDKIFFA